MDFEKEEVKLNFKTLMVEITRKCNLKCNHCFAGEPQDIVMSKHIIDRFLPQILSCGHMALTGGEPMLEPDTIAYLVDSIIKNNINVMQFSSVVNGTILDDRAVKTIMAFNRIGEYIYKEIYCKAYESKGEQIPDSLPNEKFANISISVDKYHCNNPEKAKEFYKKYANKYVGIELQTEWKKNKNKYENDVWIKNTGRAKINNLGLVETSCIIESDLDHEDYCCSDLCHRIHIENECIQCGMEITSKGYLCYSNECSYAEKDKYYICDIFKEPLSVGIYKYQWKEPLTCKEVYLLMHIETVITHPELGMDAEYYKPVKDVLLMKRHYLKVAHEMHPNLSYKDIVKAVNAELNIYTDGYFTKILSRYLPDEYSVNYKYNRKSEQNICDRIKYKAIFG